MNKNAYFKCIGKAALKFCVGLLVIPAVIYLLIALPIDICYSIYGMPGVGLGLLISILIFIFLALIENEITEYKRWSDD